MKQFSPYMADAIPTSIQNLSWMEWDQKKMKQILDDYLILSINVISEIVLFLIKKVLQLFKESSIVYERSPLWSACQLVTTSPCQSSNDEKSVFRKSGSPFDRLLVIGDLIISVQVVLLPSFSLLFNANLLPAEEMLLSIWGTTSEIMERTCWWRVGEVFRECNLNWLKSKNR